MTEFQTLFFFFFFDFFFKNNQTRPKGVHLEQCVFLRAGTDIFFYMQPERSEPTGRIADKNKIAVHWKNTLSKLREAHILCRRIPQSCKNKSGGKGGKGKRLAWRE